MGKKRPASEGEGGGSGHAGFVLPVARVRAIAKEDEAIGGVAKEAVERIATATHDLLRELVQGAAQVAKAAGGGGGGGAATVTPEDVRAAIAANPRLAFLRGVAAASEEGGFLEEYRARAKAAAQATSKRKAKGGAGPLAGLGGAVAGEDEDEEDEEEEDDEVEEALRAQEGGAAVAAAATGEQGKGAAGLALDEDYDDDE